MKRTLLTLCLMFSASYAQAYGVKVGNPILIGPLAGKVYTEFMQKLANSGAVPCETSMDSVCTSVIFVAVTGKRGKSYYFSGTVTYIYVENDTGRFRGADTRIVSFEQSLKRSNGRGL
jgi:hypothetical protein